jgi:NSS family neurotransmitter:Na+ symporter
MEIFGSYMSDKKSILGQSISICVLDTFVAVVSGLIIFPACFSFGVEPNAGPPLIFETLPNVFINMAGGRIWGTLFFLFMSFASLSTVIAVFENLIASSIENFKWSRIKSSVINCLFMLVACLPCVFGFNLLSGVVLDGKNILDIEDFIVSNVLLPGGAIVYLLFCVSKWGWGFDKYLAEVNKGDGLKMPRWFKPYLQFVLPVLILIILISGLIPS